MKKHRIYSTRTMRRETRLTIACLEASLPKVQPKHLYQMNLAIKQLKWFLKSLADDHRHLRRK